MKYYYSFYYFYKQVYPVNSIQYKYLSEIDLETMNYSYDEYLLYLREKNPSIPIYGEFLICNNEHKEYEAFFRYENMSRVCTKIYTLFTSLILYKNEFNCFDTQNKNYKELVNILISNIMSDNKTHQYFTSKKSPLDRKLKEYLHNYYNGQSFMYFKISKKLSSYNNLRTLVIEYLNLYRTVKNEMTIPCNGYSLEEINILQKAYKTPFSSEQIWILFNRGGGELVLNEVDGNDLYSLTPEDLLKLKIYTEEYYLSLKKK